MTSIDTPTAPLADPTLGGGGEADGISLPTGSLFGRYLIVDRVGVGGHGTVFSAFDPILNRRVALKLLRTSPAASGRIMREAQALARFSHPHVVAVHDVGTVDEQPYIAMELVDGSCASRAAKEADLGTRLRWMIEVARAIETAHRSGIIHRDIKPANVLIGSDGRARVTDFGLAHAVDPADDSFDELDSRDSAAVESTRPGMRLTAGLAGTPLYMAPELLDGRSAGSIRADVYGLCMTCFEVLYGVQAYEGISAPIALLEAKSKGAPASPRGSRRVPRRVRAAIERGLQPAVERRWASVSALLVELEAGRGSRRRTWMTLGVGAGLVAAGGAWVVDERAQTRRCMATDRLESVWGPERAEQIRGRLEELDLAFASRTSQRTVEALDDYGRGWLDARRQACSMPVDTGDEIRQRARVFRCLDDGLEHADALLEVLTRAEPSSAAKVGAAMEVLPALDRCWDPPGPEAEFSPEKLHALGQVGADVATLRAEVVLGMYVDAERRADELIERLEAWGDSRALAQAVFDRGRAQSWLGKDDAAAQNYRRAVTLGHRVGDSDSIVEGSAFLATFLVEVDGIAKADEARWWLDYADAEVVRAGNLPEMVSRMSVARGNVLGIIGDAEAALAAFDHALEILDGIGAGDTDAAIGAVAGRGNALFALGRFEESLAAHRRMLEMSEFWDGPGHPWASVAYQNMGRVHHSMGNIEAAIEAYQTGLEILDGVDGPKNSRYAEILHGLGTSHLRGMNFDKARDLLQRAYDLKREARGERDPWAIAALADLAIVSSAQGQQEEALSLYRRVLDAYPEQTPADLRARSHANIGYSLVLLGRPKEAIEPLQTALTLIEQVDRARRFEGPPMRALYARVLREAGQIEAARVEIDRALEEVQAVPSHPMLDAVLTEAGKVQIEAGEFEAAIETLARAHVLATEQPSELLPEIEFAWARALVAADRDHARARDLVAAARARWEAGGPSGSELATLEAWARTTFEP